MIDEKLQRLKEKFPGLWLAAKGIAHGRGMTITQYIALAIEEKIDRDKETHENT